MGQPQATFQFCVSSCTFGGAIAQSLHCLTSMPIWCGQCLESASQLPLALGLVSVRFCYYSSLKMHAGPLTSVLSAR